MEATFSPAVAKQDTLYSVIAWPDSFLALEQLCVDFFGDGALPSLLRALACCASTQGCTHLPHAFPNQMGSFPSLGFHPCLLCRYAVCSTLGQ